MIVQFIKSVKNFKFTIFNPHINHAYTLTLKQV
jgi:hypothetical protein